LRRPLHRKTIQVLSGINFQVRQASLCAVLGPNGAGKSTLLKILAASLLPDAGHVSILGQDSRRHPTRTRKQLGVVLSDERSFYWRLTAKQNLRFFGTLCNVPKQALEIRMEELSELFEITNELNKPFFKLSTGFRHRLALARALMHHPKILLMDEPTQGLDPHSAARVRRIIRDTLCSQLGQTIVLTTHNLDEARICDQMFYLDHGAIRRTTPDHAAQLFRLKSEC
jgi:ABC-2 type transport system ATP-binding protein